MPDKIELTRAGVRDAKILAQLSVSTFYEAFGAQNRKEDMDKYASEEMTPDKLAKELENKENFFFLAWYNGRLAGYCKMRVNREPEIMGDSPIELERIYVVEQFHGRHIGAALMGHCVEHAISGKHDVLWLGVWELNFRAISFYKKWGFELCGSHPFLLGDDLQTDVLMRRNCK
jgi:ribosomal protein S18 acetylase RimI-like enzyme